MKAGAKAGQTTGDNLHERVAAVESDIKSIKKTQERMESKLDALLDGLRDGGLTLSLPLAPLGPSRPAVMIMEVARETTMTMIETKIARATATSDHAGKAHATSSEL